MAKKKVENQGNVVEEKMKNLAELSQEFNDYGDNITKVSAEIVDNENVVIDMLTTKELFITLVYRELAKAVETAEYSLVLDCNYPESNFHNKTEKQKAKGQEDEWKVDYFRVVSKDAKQTSLMQIYVGLDLKHGNIKFAICTSCARLNRKQFMELHDTLKFIVKFDKTGRAKTSVRADISYYELVNVIKSAYVVLTNGEKLKEEFKALPKEERKQILADERKARLEEYAEEIEEEPEVEEETPETEETEEEEA